jgi:hypothetical protein
MVRPERYSKIAGGSPPSSARNSGELTPQAALSGLTIGLLVGALEVALVISFAALVFAGPLADHLGNGIAMALLGATIGISVVGMLTSLPGTVAGSQDAPAAVLAAMTATIVSRMPAAGSEALFLTAAATVILSTLLTGVAFWHSATSAWEVEPVPALSGHWWLPCRHRMAPGGQRH